MSLPDETFDRWLANARAAGIRFSREDAERIAASGLEERMTRLHELFEELEALDRVPDFLGNTAGVEMPDERQ